MHNELYQGSPLLRLKWQFIENQMYCNIYEEKVQPMCMTSGYEFALHLCGAILLLFNLVI